MGVKVLNFYRIRDIVKTCNVSENTSSLFLISHIQIMINDNVIESL